MVLPLLEYSPTSQNQRVAGFEVGSDQQPRIYSTNSLLSAVELDDLIAAAYRQIFNEQQMTASSRQLPLESQLRSGQITVRDFVAGLASSDHFRSRNYETNNNYRFVQMCVQRLLGREVYNDREKFAWSTLLATQGLKAFIHELVNTEEYLDTFGTHTVPYQRRRILPLQTTGMISFAHMARYDAFHRDNLPQPQGGLYGGSAYRWAWQTRPNPALAKVGGAIVWGGVAVIGFLAVAALFNW
jgi:phycobilisome rod-core linker protein